MGIVCLNCDTHWHDKDAFDRGEPDADDGAEGVAADGFDEDDGATDEGE